MATFVQAAQGANQVSPTNATFGSAVTTGDTIIVISDCLSGTTSSVTDSQSNSYTMVFGPFSISDGSNTHSITVWMANNVTGDPALVVTCHGTYIISSCLDYSTATPLTADTSATTSGAGSSTTQSVGPTPTTAAANELLLAYITNAGGVTHTAGAGYTIRSQTSSDALFGIGFATEDRSVSSTGTYSASFTLGGAKTAGLILVTFETGGGPPPATPKPVIVIMG